MSSTSSYVSYRFRFIVLLTFCIVNASNAIQWICFAPISSLTSAFFNVDIEKVNGLSICYLALYLPGSILGMWLFGRYSLRTGFLVAAWMTAIGGWIRYASSFGDVTSGAAYGGLIFGQCISALAQPLFTNIPAKVSSRWFPVKERDIATVLGAMSNPVGIAISTIVASSFVFIPTGETEIVGMNDWLLTQALIATIAALISMFTFKDRPPTPPSASQENSFSKMDSSDNNNNFRKSFSAGVSQVMECFAERDFVWLFIAFGIGLGMFNGLSTVVEQITAPNCATPEDASLFGGLLIGLGLIGAFICGVVLDRTHRYRLALRVGFGGSAVFTLILTLVLQNGMLDAVAALFALLGLFILPMLPTAFSAAAEVTYPVSEDISSGILMTIGQYTGIGFIFAFGALIPPKQTTCVAGTFTYPGSSILLVVSVFISFFFILLFKGSNKRLNVDSGSALFPVVGDNS